MNWSKYILLLLPPRLRFVRLHAFLTVLLSPIVSLYDQFQSWQARKKMQLSATPQTIWLPKIIWEEMGAKIGIEYNDNIPDFWVIVYDNNVDIPRLRTLIEHYKLAGKSYNFRYKDIVISQSWSNYVCEIYEVLSNWSSYVCEKKDKQHNRITLNFLGAGFDIEAKADYYIDDPMLIYYYRENVSEVQVLYFSGISQMFHIEPGGTTANKPIKESFYLGRTEDDNFTYELIIK